MLRCIKFKNQRAWVNKTTFSKCSKSVKFIYFCRMLERIFILIGLFFASLLNAQIVVDNTTPYDVPDWLVNNILLGGGITASNIAYQGDSAQIGWFDAVNTNLGVDSGIVMCTGDIYALDPVNGGGFPIIANTVTDPDLLNVANSVPPLIGQSFTVSSINDVAILEFEFIPTSDSLTFNYAFGSQEYFGFENTQYNDVFGFFLSGPGITGPYSSPTAFPGGSINLAVVPGSTPPLPITISSINSVTPINQQYFVPNQGTGLDTIADADGFTTVLTARALVQCGETYHIRLAIADGSDQGLSSYVWLEAGSFYSPPLEIIDELGIDSTVMEIPCNSSIMLTANGGLGATYEWFDSLGTVISTDSAIVVASGTYWVTATSLGCPLVSDTLKVIQDDSPVFDLGVDYNIPCNTTTIIDPVVTGGRGTPHYTYLWSTGSVDSMVEVSQGTYILEVDDGTGCYFKDTIVITEDPVPLTVVSGGGAICDDASLANVSFYFDGLLPWDLVYTDGNTNYTITNIPTPNHTILSLVEGTYSIVESKDVNSCISDTLGSAQIIVNPLPQPVISPKDTTIYIGDLANLDAGEYADYRWYTASGELVGGNQVLEVADSGSFYIWVEDENGCSNTSDSALVQTLPKTELFIPNIFTPNNDEHNELFTIKGVNIAKFYLAIYNRWGDMVFESYSLDKYWDGSYDNRRVPQGTYFYTVEVLGEDAELFNLKGSFVVIY